MLRLAQRLSKAISCPLLLNILTNQPENMNPNGHSSSSPVVSVLPIQENGRQTHIVLTCDSVSRKIQAFSTIDNQLLGEFKFKKPSLNSNHPKICCQLGPMTFLFVETQTFGTVFDQVQVPETLAVIRQFGSTKFEAMDTTLIQQESLSVRDCDVIVNNYGYLILKPKLSPSDDSTLWVILIRPNFDINQNIDLKKQYKFLRETVQLPDNLSDQNDQNRIFLILPDKIQPKLLILQIDTEKSTMKLLTKELWNDENRNWKHVDTEPDPVFGIPSKLFNQPQLSYILGDQVYFLIRDNNTKFSLWVLRNTGKFQWQKINMDINSTGTIVNFFVTDNQCYIIQQIDQDHDQLRINNIGFIDRPTTLQQIAKEQSLQSFGHQSLPKHILTSTFLDWFNRKSFGTYKLDETLKITIVRLRPEMFEKFCHQVLKITDPESILQKTKILNRKNGRFEVEFENRKEKQNFLEYCRKETENLNLFAPNTVEIYCNEAWFENITPIVISLPNDFAVLRPML